MQNLKSKTQIIGLTGPAGAGKDTVAKILKRRGAYIINVDELAHEIYPLVLDKLVKTFGKGILDKNGAVDRKELGKIVFGDKKKLSQLNKIIHPLLKKELAKKLEKLSVVSCQLLVINAALSQMFEGMVDEIWVVLASRETRLKRIENRKIIDMQASEEEYRRLADVIIENEGTIQELNAQIQAHLKIQTQR